jgi:hypothetical protein
MRDPKYAEVMTHAQTTLDAELGTSGRVQRVARRER